MIAPIQQVELLRLLPTPRGARFRVRGHGLFDEALVQYDELDALFTQFVLNCNVGESPPWLSSFSSELADWTGLSLDRLHSLKAQLFN